MAQGFNSPGVTVTEVSSPAIAPSGAAPSTIALIGTAAGKAPFSERFILSGVVTQLLTQTGVDSTSVVVKKADTLATVSGGHYVVVQSADPDGVALSGDEQFTIRRIAQPSAAATIAQGAGGIITASVGVVYAIAYSNANGETGLGPDSNSITVAAKQIGLTGIPISADASVTGRKIYRKLSAPDGDGLYHLVGTISDNTTTVYTDNLAEVTAEAAKTQEVTVTSGDTVNVAYNYTDVNYYLPTHFDAYVDVLTKYGDPFSTADGSITSALSFAARIAFANGASEVICVASKTSGQVDFQTALDALKSEENVNYVVPITGTAAIHTAAQAHCVMMNGQGFFRSAIVGRDGSVTPVTAATLRAAATAYNDENIILVSPAAFDTVNPVTGKVQTIGGQYVAPALAGMIAARDPQVPLTRKSVAMFADVHDKRTSSDKSLDEYNGLCVIENKGGVIRVWHGLTTAAGNVNTREISVVRIKHEMARRLRDSLDSAVVGQTFPMNEVPSFTAATVRSVLNAMVIEGALSDFGGINARLTDDPTVVEVRFEFIPIYPLNRVQVNFSINTINGIFSTAL